jgi:hypothetical protein
MKTVSWTGLGLTLVALILAAGCHKKPTDSDDATPHPSITITSPNGGESWVVGQTYSITWSSSNIVGNVKIEYCRDYPSGSWVALIDDKANSGSYSWHVTSSRTQTARVRISNLDEPSVYDVSDENFALTDAWTVMVYADGNNNLDGADYALYSFLTCEDFPNNPASCTSDQEGCEDFICSVQGLVDMRILVNAYQGPMGGYRLLIDEAGSSARRGAGVFVLEPREARTAVR